uniref:Uncharacterized protein n=1 Tax=Anguilla anguilla TaxID=7936 RepID=A0A0E9VS65_ANGAN
MKNILYRFLYFMNDLSWLSNRIHLCGLGILGNCYYSALKLQ